MYIYIYIYFYTKGKCFSTISMMSCYLKLIGVVANKLRSIFKTHKYTDKHISKYGMLPPCTRIHMRLKQLKFQRNQCKKAIQWWRIFNVVILDQLVLPLYQ